MLRKTLPAISVFTASLLFGNPSGGWVVEGAAEFDGCGASDLSIRAGDKSIIEWDSFSIGLSETTRFIQPSADAAVLNRVTGDLRSDLFGSLLANGKVFLINPNGVLVGKEGLIDTGSFAASAFDLSNEAFLAGAELRFEGDSASPLINEGTIRAKNGDVLLVAQRVENLGTLSSPEGSVLIGAGRQILVGINGLFIRADLPGDGILNDGKIEALRTVFEASANPHSLGIQNTGSIDALNLSSENGEVYLRCKGAPLTQRGSIQAKEIAIVPENSLFENWGEIEGRSLAVAAFSQEDALTDQRHTANYGRLSADTIQIGAAKFDNSGAIVGKNISLFVPGVYIDTESSSVAGEEIKIAAGNYFASGTTSAVGKFGGRIEIDAEQFTSMAATFDASGQFDGGTIRISSASLQHPLYLNAHTIVDVSAAEQGGVVEILSPLSVASFATIRCDGQADGILNVPSSFAYGAAETTLVDPNPDAIPSLWTAFSQLRKEAPANAWAVNDLEIAYLDLMAPMFAKPAACPPIAIELIDPNPTGVVSSFGDFLLPLPSGNLVVTKKDDSFGAPNAGAVYVYNAGTGALISTLRGSNMNDFVGYSMNYPDESVILLTNGNFVVSSLGWNSMRGASTWGSGTTGVSGTVSSANSLVGAAPMDLIGSDNIFALTNGNYVVASSQCTILGNATAGAATWGDGSSGTSGTVDHTNSLYGATAGDLVGLEAASDGVLVLTNGNYVVISLYCDIGGNSDAGAATWADGAAGTVGAVSAANSLTGAMPNDLVGGGFSEPLVSGDYVVASPYCEIGGIPNAGAATWCSGSGPTTGNPTAANSTHGTSSADNVGIRIVPLTNGHYVVCSPNWRGGTFSRGAATWADGSGPTSVAVTEFNSIYGTTLGDNVGGAATALTNGNYVIQSSSWHSGALVNAGAATFCLGTGFTSGAVDSTNSLVGSHMGDQVGALLIPLAQGNYVVFNSGWNTLRGFASWGSGTSGVTGVVSAANSLIGTIPTDQVASEQVVALTNGNYVINSAFFESAGFMDGGAVTWVDGTTGLVGMITAGNSLLGDMATEEVGFPHVLALTNGNFATATQNYPDMATGYGAVTWSNGSQTATGNVNAGNSLVGSQINDLVGKSLPSTPSLKNLSSLEFVIFSSDWANGANAAAGAVTIANSADGTFCDGAYGAISSSNSFVGDFPNTGLNNLAIVNASSGDNYAIAQFNSYNGETRIFSLAGTPTPPTAPSSASSTVPAYGLHDFAIAVSEAYTRWTSMTLTEVLAASTIYPPLGTHVELRLWLPSLAGAENRLPQITYR